MKGIPKEICEHEIELVVDAQPIKQRHIYNESKLCIKSKRRFGQVIWYKNYLSHWNYTMVVSFGDSTKEKWEVTNVWTIIN